MGDLKIKKSLVTDFASTPCYPQPNFATYDNWNKKTLNHTDKTEWAKYLEHRDFIIYVIFLILITVKQKIECIVILCKHQNQKKRKYETIPPKNAFPQIHTANLSADNAPILKNKSGIALCRQLAKMEALYSTYDPLHQKIIKGHPIFQSPMPVFPNKTPANPPSRPPNTEGVQAIRKPISRKIMAPSSEYLAAQQKRIAQERMLQVQEHMSKLPEAPNIHFRQEYSKDRATLQSKIDFWIMHAENLFKRSRVTPKEFLDAQISELQNIYREYAPNQKIDARTLQRAQSMMLCQIDEHSKKEILEKIITKRQNPHDFIKKIINTGMKYGLNEWEFTIYAQSILDELFNPKTIRNLRDSIEREIMNQWTKPSQNTALHADQSPHSPNRCNKLIKRLQKNQEHRTEFSAPPITEPNTSHIRPAYIREVDTQKLQSAQSTILCQIEEDSKEEALEKIITKCQNPHDFIEKIINIGMKYGLNEKEFTIYTQLTLDKLFNSKIIEDWRDGIEREIMAMYREPIVDCQRENAQTSNEFLQAAMAFLSLKLDKKMAVYTSIRIFHKVIETIDLSHLDAIKKRFQQRHAQENAEPPRRVERTNSDLQQSSQHPSLRKRNGLCDLPKRRPVGQAPLRPITRLRKVRETGI